MKHIQDISFMLNILKDKLMYYRDDEIMLANVQGQIYSLLWVLEKDPEEAWDLIKKWRNEAAHTKQE
jgi:hypothetical protein